MLLQLAGSSSYGARADAVVADAALFIDHTNFDGKSGYVRLQKGLTAGHVVISSRPIACETVGEFQKTPFLQRNLVPVPKLPELHAPGDYTLVVAFLKVFNPRKQDTSVLIQALTRVRITKLTSMAPWISSAKVPDADIDAIHLHDVSAAVRTPSAAAGKIYEANPPGFNLGITVVVISPDHASLHLDPRGEQEPFEVAPLVLHRGDNWTADIDIKGKEMSVKGTVPLCMCEPVVRKINEYEKK